MPSLANAELPAQIECTSAQKTAISAETAHRSLLSGGAGYGFCVADSCDPSLDLVGGKCVAKPTPKWISTTTQSVVEGDYDVVLRASLPHASMDEGGATFALSSGASTATEDDFTLSSQSVHFAQGSVVSDPLIVHLHRRPGYQAPREIQLSLNGKTLSIAITDSERAQALAYTAPVMSTTEGETVEMEISFNQVLSQLFPTKVKVQVGDQTLSALVPARKDKVTVSLATTSAMTGSPLPISVVGMDGTQGSLTVAGATCADPADEAAAPFHATVQHDFGDGHGIVPAKLVCNKSELLAVSDSFDGPFVLGDNIDLLNSSLSGYIYSSIDGNNYTIKNCSYSGVQNNVGCLGKGHPAQYSGIPFDDIVIRNLTLKEVQITTTQMIAGGFLPDGSRVTFDNVHIEDADIVSSQFAGGITGVYGIIKNSSVSNSSTSSGIFSVAWGTVSNSTWDNVSIFGNPPTSGAIP